MNERKLRVCAECGHVRSRHVQPGEETAGSYGCMHEDVANGSGGAGYYCRCRGYREEIRSSHSGYDSDVREADYV